MSQAIPTIDVSNINTVGQQATLSLGDMGQPSMVVGRQGSPTLQIFCESGIGFIGQTNQSNKTFALPAGGWASVELSNSDNAIILTAQYILQNAPVSKIMATYYYPGETVPDTPSLGNSPIGIAGTVTTTGVQTLSNEGAAAGTLIVDYGPSGNLQATEWWNDHFLVNVVQSGTKHQVLAGNTSGNPLQIGKAGDITEVLGQLTVDQLLTAVAGIVVSGSVSPAIDISGDTGAVGLKLKVGTWTRTQMIGDTTIAHAGTSVAHTLGVIPTGVFWVQDAGTSTTDIISVNYGTMTSSAFTAYTSNATSTGNIRFFVFAF